ncbi:hypothetical protein TTHERM_00471660 (macronuclear) [Tetrahymena thermophila SB210]|uniref:Uncharacterized protein n=1 Tax=Tetrahymena thermophila (strain SB210) TaxID=312017 RepID=I7M6K7_TETTS|nr:hypothetical protein TTHERM_00471660 [Tetrahymena thermophila SB210]EAR85387.2 hypothetical protein TTHERM_00471660 [Tetrahymena thermophila SB210]|eukprot:XP_001033050.2 hypothetical protein TTHERM_00471660 [Tetrahymena thermophila SB210]
MNHPYQMQSLMSLPYPNQNMCFYINNNSKLITPQNSFQSAMPNNICSQANQINIQALNKLQYHPIFSQQNYQPIPQQVIYSNIELDNQQNQELPITYQQQNYRFGSFKQNLQPDSSYQYEAFQMKSRKQPAQTEHQSENSVSRKKKFSHSSEQVKYSNNHSCLISESQIGDITCQSPSQKSIKISKPDNEITCNSEKKFKQKGNCSSFQTQKQEYNSEENEQTNYIQNNREISINNEYDNQIKNQQKSQQNTNTIKRKQIQNSKNQKQQVQFENLNSTKNNSQSKKDNLFQTKNEFELPINQNCIESQFMTQIQQDNSYLKGKQDNRKNGKANKKRIQKHFQDIHSDNQTSSKDKLDLINSQPSIFQAKLEEQENQNSQLESINNFSVQSQNFSCKFQSQLNNHQISNNSENAQNIVNTPSASADCKLDFTCRMNEFTETDSEQQKQYSSSQEPQLTKKYCKIRFLSDSSPDDKKDMIKINKQSEVIIICSVRPKDKIKKSKQDYYNDSNYTKNLLKGFRRYMKRFTADQLIFQQFQIYFTNNQLNNEFILKLFSDNEYSSYFNKFLSQPPHWWIQEAKIKDVEKQINFFNLCKQKKINHIKTKRKSFERPQIYFM